MSGEPRRVSGGCVRALRWDEGGEPTQSCSEGMGELQRPHLGPGEQKLIAKTEPELSAFLFKCGQPRPFMTTHQ